MLPESRSLFVYILASRSGVLYTGCTRDLHRRVYQHKHGLCPGFTRDYRVTRLVWFDHHLSTRSAVARERQIKGWRRARKVELIEHSNSGWIDLAEDWFQ